MNIATLKTEKVAVDQLEVYKNVVVFSSPGTFVHETSEYEVEEWDVDKAAEMARDIKERHGARPFGFMFKRIGRKTGELDAYTTASSVFYYLGGNIRTAEEVLAGDSPDESILRSNVRNNDIKRILVNNNSYRSTHSLDDDDVVLDFQI